MSDDGSTSPLSEASELDDEYDHGIDDDKDADESESEDSQADDEEEELADQQQNEQQQEDESDDSVDTYGYSRRRGLVTSFHDAIERLMETPHVHGLTLRLRRGRRGTEAGGMMLFARFVSVLQRHGAIECITFVKTRFDELLGGGNDENDDYNEGTFDANDLDRLFGSVLPNHPTMRYVTFTQCVVPSRYVRMFADGLNAMNGRTPELPWVLSVKETELDLSAVQGIAGALRRNAFHHLSLHDTGMTSPKCRLITGAAAECDGLTVLAVVEWGRSNSSLQCLLPWIIDEEAFAPNSISKLFLDECMWFGGSSWTDGGATELFRQLRTNERQERISIVNMSDDQSRYWEELLTTYNCTLWKLNAPFPDEWVPRLVAGLERGELAKDARDHLEPSNYQVEMRGLWPWVMDSVKTYPTLLYRFLRRGNVAALADQVGRHASDTERRLRRSVRISKRKRRTIG